MVASAARPIHYLERELYQRVGVDHDLFDFLQEGSLDGIWYWDLDHREHEWMSPRFWEVLGYEPGEKEHLSSEWQAVIFPDDLEVALANLDAHLADPEHPYDQVVRYRHKNGSTVWVRCRGIAIRDAARRPIRMLGAHNDVTALKRAEEEVIALNARVANAVVATAEATAEERERQSLARDLHDDLGQLLALAALKLGRLRGEVPATSREVLADVEKLIHEARERTESFTFRLSPPLLQDVGLVAAAEWLAEEIKRRYGLSVTVHHDGRPKLLDEATRVTLFRALRELLINVARHAKTSVAHVRLWSTDAAAVGLSVEDAGVGFDRSDEPYGFGLFSIRERLHQLGGSVTIEAAPGNGVKVVLLAPAGPDGGATETEGEGA